MAKAYQNRPNLKTTRLSPVHPFKEPARQDPYRSECKPSGTPQCPLCQSVSIRGRWVFMEQLKKMHLAVLPTGELKCPACRQKEDHYAQGVIELIGCNLKEQIELMDQILNTVKNTEQIAQYRNNQERILWIDQKPLGCAGAANEAHTHSTHVVTKIYVTLPELARQIGRELKKSFQCETEYIRSSEEPYLRVACSFITR